MNENYNSPTRGGSGPSRLRRGVIPAPPWSVLGLLRRLCRCISARQWLPDRNTCKLFKTNDRDLVCPTMKPALAAHSPTPRDGRLRRAVRNRRIIVFKGVSS
jgi:hypothetical protein